MGNGASAKRASARMANRYGGSAPAALASLEREAASTAAQIQALRDDLAVASRLPAGRAAALSGLLRETRQRLVEAERAQAEVAGRAQALVNTLHQRGTLHGTALARTIGPTLARLGVTQPRRTPLAPVTGGGFKFRLRENTTATTAARYQLGRALYRGDAPGARAAAAEVERLTAERQAILEEQRTYRARVRAGAS